MYDLLDGQGLDMTCADGPGEARKLFREGAFDGVIADKRGALVLRDIHTGRLKSSGGPCKVLLVLSEPDGLEEIPDLMRLDANSGGVTEWIDRFMGWLD